MYNVSTGTGNSIETIANTLVSFADRALELREDPALMRPVEGQRLLCDPYFYPIYDQASRLDMPIVVHIANGNPWLCSLYDHPSGSPARSIASGCPPSPHSTMFS